MKALGLAVVAAVMALGAVQPSPAVRQMAAGRASLERKDYAAAAWAFRQVLLADSTDDEARRLLAKALYEQSRQRGVAAMAQGDWGRAQQAWLEALDAAPDSGEAREKLRVTRCALANDIPALEACLLVQPDNAAARQKLADFRFRRQRLDWLSSGNFLQLDRTGGAAGLPYGAAMDRYLAGAKRRAFFERWSLPMAAAYLLLLLGGTWLGLRRVVRQT